MYFAERALAMRDEHQPKTADDRIEGLVLQVKLFGIHYARGDSGQPLLLEHLRGDGEHVGRNVGRQNRAGRSHDACREETLIPGARGNVEDMVSRLETCRFEHAVRRFGEVLPAPFHILLPALCLR